MTMRRSLNEAQQTMREQPEADVVWVGRGRLEIDKQTAHQLGGDVGAVVPVSGIPIDVGLSGAIQTAVHLVGLNEFILIVCRKGAK